MRFREFSWRACWFAVAAYAAALAFIAAGGGRDLRGRWFWDDISANAAEFAVFVFAVFLLRWIALWAASALSPSAGE